MTDIRERVPRFSLSASLEIPGDSTVHLTYAGEPPTELMDQYKQIIGDGQARVSLTWDYGAKDFGTGCSASVTVSLTCDQSQAGIAAAVGLAEACAKFYVRDQFIKADTELRQLIANRPSMKTT